MEVSIMARLKVEETKTKHPLEKEFVVTIPHEDIASRVQAALEKRAKTVKIDGFRPGKVPVSVIEQREGNHIVSDVMDDLLSETAQSVLKDHKIRPATRPHFHPKSHYKKGQDFAYVMHVEALPTIKDVDIEKLALNRYNIKGNADKLKE